VRCKKPAEPIDMPFWMKIWEGVRNYVLDEVQISQKEWAIFGGCPGHSKALQSLLQRRCSVAVAFASKGIIHASIMSCSRRDHSVCLASANSILQISGAGDAAYQQRRG